MCRPSILLFFCLTWSALSAQQVCNTWVSPLDSIKIIRHKALYEEYAAKEEYLEAVYFWEYIFEHAPGAFESLYKDGIALYKFIIEQEENLTQRNFYLRKLAAIYDKKVKCYPQKQIDILSRKAYDLHQLGAADNWAFDEMKKAIALAGNYTPAYLLSPFSGMAVGFYAQGKMPLAEFDQWRTQLISIAQFQIEINKDEKYATALQYVYKNMGRNTVDVVTIRGNDSSDMPADCNYFIEKYAKAIEAQPDNTDLISRSLLDLKRLGCTEGEDRMAHLLAKLSPSVKMGGNNEVRSSTHLATANDLLREEKYQASINEFLLAINQEMTDAKEKATYLVKVAEIAYAKISDKSLACFYATEALKFQPTWGKPHLLIGDLYVSDARQCYPTDALMQKAVVQAAMDKWQLAAADPACQSEANDRIRKYRPYLPTKSELFLRDIKNGKTVRLDGCWINEKVRLVGR